MKTVAATILILACVSSATAGAAAETPTLKQTVIGVGAMSCGEFGKRFGRNPSQIKDAFMSWAQGYMSGTFIAAQHILVKTGAEYKAVDLMPPELGLDAQWQHLMQFCDQRPLAGFHSAVIDLMKELTAAQSE